MPGSVASGTHLYYVQILFRVEKKNEYHHKNRTYHPKSERLLFILHIIHDDCKCQLQT